MVDTLWILKLHSHVIMITPEMYVKKQPMRPLEIGVTALQHGTKVRIIKLKVIFNIKMFNNL